MDYFGTIGYLKIEEILNQNGYNVQKTVSDLQEYTSKRNKFVALIDGTSDNLKALNIVAHIHTDSTFEVGLLMPEELTDNKIVKITKELNQWDKVFKSIKELTGEPAEDTEINFVNNGSMEFFIDNAPQIAICLVAAVERITKIYKNIVEIRATRERLKELGVSSVEQKSIEKQEKELLNKELDKIGLDLVKEFASKQLDTGRANELKVAMKGHIVYIAKCIDGGMIIEVNPPEISEPAVAKESDPDEKKAEAKKLKANYDLTLKKIEVVQKSMDTIKTIGKTGADVIKYLTDGESKSDE